MNKFGLMQMLSGDEVVGKLDMVVAVGIKYWKGV